MQLFDIFPKPEPVYEKWVNICAKQSAFKKWKDIHSEATGFDCTKCPYGKTVRENTCFDICLKGDFFLWLDNYDMSKPLLRRYIGPYEWEKEEC